MKKIVGVLERAFDISRSGAVQSLGQLHAQLKKEGFKTLHRVVAPGMSAKLKAVIKAAGAAHAPIA